MKAALLALVLLFLSVGRVDADQLPTGLDGLGVCIHFWGNQTQNLNMIQAAGIKLVRADTLWEAVETTKGAYNWSGLDGLIQGCVDRGIRPLLILDHDSPLYSSDHSSNDYIQGFTNFATTAADRYQGKGIVWELYNEPEICGFTADSYMGLANSVLPSIRAADPSAAIVGPAAWYGDGTFLRGCFDQGLLGMVDAVAAHWYRPQTPQTGAPKP